jgi:hypothetical protein
MWRFIAMLLGLPSERKAVGPSKEAEGASFLSPHESPGTPEDSPAPAPQQPPAEPVPDTLDQGEAKPVRFPYPVPAPSRNGTRTRH